MNENEKWNIWEMLLWLKKNNSHLLNNDQKNVFIVHEYKLVKKLGEDKQP